MRPVEFKYIKGQLVTTKFDDEVRFLYKWWQTRKDGDDDSQDDEMLIRLMKIRCALWT